MLYSEDDYKRKQAQDARAEEAAAEWAQAVRRADDNGLLIVIQSAHNYPIFPCLCLINGQAWRDEYRRA